MEPMRAEYGICPEQAVWIFWAPHGIHTYFDELFAVQVSIPVKHAEQGSGPGQRIIEIAKL